MGFLEDLSNTVNRGAASAGRASKTFQLRQQMGDLMKQRQGLAAQLGASLYEATRDVAEFREGREQLYDGIAAIDVHRAQVQAELDRIEQEAIQAQMASTTYRCPRCGSTVAATDLFCAGCGLSIAEVKAASDASSAVPGGDGSVCPRCGSPISEGDKFCMSCGAPVEKPVVAVESAPEPPVLTCPVCGAPYGEGDRFCAECGNDLRPQASPANACPDEGVSEQQ